MKTKIFTLLFLSVLLFANAQQTYVPDDNFEEALIIMGYDNFPLDDYVPTANINTITSLNIMNQGISDLTGIEDFTALETLYCSDNGISSLGPVSTLSNLKRLECDRNQLSSIDTDISGLSNLENLSCSDNQLTSLNVSVLSNLKLLRCISNQLTSLNITGLSNLENLYFEYNQLTSINLLGLNSLTSITCQNNQLTYLNVSAFNNLIYLDCRNNQLTELNVKNGNNTNFNLFGFKATNNPNLVCIQVDDAAWSTANWSNIDPTTSYSENCNYAQTYVPDDNFEAYLEINGMGNGIANDDYVATININTVTNLSVNSKNIADLTGIQDFTALQSLYCQSNQLTSLNVSNLNNLTGLSCDENQLTTLNVSGLSNLQYLDCYNNFITDLDLLGLNNLEYLYCDYNQLTSLDVSGSSNILHLWCSNNQLTELNVQNGNNTNINSFYADYNPDLTCIFVDDAAYSTANWPNIDSTATFVETQTECNALLSTDAIFLTDFVIHPNPTNNILNINVKETLNFALYNISGKEILNGKLLQGENILKLSNITNGVYFIKLYGNDKSTVRKIVKQ